MLSGAGWDLDFLERRRHVVRVLMPRWRDARGAQLIHPPRQSLPKALPTQLLPIGDQLLEDLSAAELPFLAEALDAGLQPREPPGPLEKLARAQPLRLGENIDAVDPNVAIVDLAQERLHPLHRRQGLVERLAVDRPGKFDRVAKPLRGDPHGVVPPLVARVLQAVLIAEHFVQPAEDVPTGLLADEIAVVARLQPFASGSLPWANRALVTDCICSRTFALASRSAALLTFGCNTSRSCSNLAKSRAMPGKQRLSVNRRQGAAEEVDLHVLVAGVAQFAGDAADLLPPTLHRLAAEAVGEHLQRRPQPPRGHPRAMDALDVLRRAHAVELLGKLLRLPANVPCGKEPIAGVPRLGHALICCPVRATAFPQPSRAPHYIRRAEGNPQGEVHMASSLQGDRRTRKNRKNRVFPRLQ